MLQVRDTGALCVPFDGTDSRQLAHPWFSALVVEMVDGLVGQVDLRQPSTPVGSPAWHQELQSCSCRGPPGGLVRTGSRASCSPPR